VTAIVCEVDAGDRLGLHRFRCRIRTLLALVAVMAGAMKGADHNERLARKYQRAAARPWLAIEPDSE
jgi:hypothetical protein